MNQVPADPAFLYVMSCYCCLLSLHLFCNTSFHKQLRQYDRNIFHAKTMYRGTACN